MVFNYLQLLSSLGNVTAIRGWEKFGQTEWNRIARDYDRRHEAVIARTDKGPNNMTKKCMLASFSHRKVKRKRTLTCTFFGMLFGPLSVLVNK